MASAIKAFILSKSARLGMSATGCSAVGRLYARRSPNSVPIGHCSGKRDTALRSPWRPQIGCAAMQDQPKQQDQDFAETWVLPADELAARRKSKGAAPGRGLSP